MKSILFILISGLISSFLSFGQSGDYAVQLAAFNQKVPLSYFSGFDNVYEQRSHSTMYKYYVSDLKTESDAKVLKDKAHKAGFKHARVINLVEALENSASCCMNFSEPANTISIRNLFFDFDRSNLRTESKSELKKVAKVLRENPDYFVEVRAHTDSKGENAYNDALSQRRRDAAVTYLRTLGIDDAKINTKYFGEGQPVAKNELDGGTDTPEGRQLNRRVELVIKDGAGEVDIVEDIQVPDNLKVN